MSVCVWLLGMQAPLPVFSLSHWSMVETSGSLCQLHTHEHTHAPSLNWELWTQHHGKPSREEQARGKPTGRPLPPTLSTSLCFSLFLQQKSTVFWPLCMNGIKTWIFEDVSYPEHKQGTRKWKTGVLWGTAGGRSGDSLRGKMTEAERSRPPRHLFNTSPPTLPEASFSLLLYVLVYFFFNLLSRAKTKQSEGWMAFQSFATSALSLEIVCFWIRWKKEVIDMHKILYIGGWKSHL